MADWKAPVVIAGIAVAGISGYFGWVAYGSPEVRACEYFIKDGLRSPSSYSRAEVLIGNEPITIEELHELRPPSFLDTAIEGERSLHLVSIEYDADNAFGTRVRGVEVCAFEMTDGELPRSSVIESNARQSASKRSIRQLSDAGMIDGLPPGTSPQPARFSCCLN